MKHPFMLLLQYSWLFALAMSILFQIRCYTLSRILKNEYSVTNAGLAATTQWAHSEEIGVKEIKHLMMQLNYSRTWLKTFLIAAVVIFISAYFM